MFGKPEWFRDKKVGWGLVPIRWQGWVYTALWCLILAGPFLLLIARENIVGGLVWVAAMLLALVWDVRQIKRARQVPSAARAKNDSVLYIGDDDTLSTKNLDLHLRR